MGRPRNHSPEPHSGGKEYKCVINSKESQTNKQIKPLLATGLDNELDLERGGRKAFWHYGLHDSKALCTTPLYVQTFPCLFVWMLKLLNNHCSCWTWYFCFLFLSMKPWTTQPHHRWAREPAPPSWASYYQVMLLPGKDCLAWRFVSWALHSGLCFFL